MNRVLRFYLFFANYLNGNKVSYRNVSYRDYDNIVDALNDHKTEFSNNKGYIISAATKGGTPNIAVFIKNEKGEGCGICTNYYGMAILLIINNEGTFTSTSI